MIKSIKPIGTLTLTKGKVTITDPCYKKGTWCTAEVDNVFKGDWQASVEIPDSGNWKDMVSKLILRAINHTAVKYKTLKNEICVDAGVCGVFENKPDYNDDDWDGICDNMRHKKYGLANTSNAFKCIGAWSISGFGDGSYKATIGLNEENEVVEIMVDYREEE